MYFVLEVLELLWVVCMFVFGGLFFCVLFRWIMFFLWKHYPS